MLRKFFSLVAAVFLSCGGGAEAKVPVGAIALRFAVVGDWKVCDNHWPLVAIQQELIRVTRSKVMLYVNYDITLPVERPDLLTLEHFWDSSLGDYWRGRIPEGNEIRVVLLPPLIYSDGRPMYGGMSYGKGPTRGWCYVNVGDNAYRYRVTYAVLHELGHIMGKAIDNCTPGQPSIMCWSDVAYYKTNPSQIHYNAIQERQIRKRLGLKAGKTMVVR